jgi:galactose-1-phosphate uridylyltransferase
VDDWEALAVGVVRIQKLYRHLCRNGYNLGLLTVENGSGHMELRVVMTVRSNYDAWVRNDHTGFELMLGDMATFTAPEETAEIARGLWPGSGSVTTEPSHRFAGPFPPSDRSSSD